MFNPRQHRTARAVCGLAAVLTIGAVCTARAQLLAGESFDYSEGAFIHDQNGGDGFDGRWLGAPKFFGEDTKAVRPGLAYPGYPSGGGAARMNRADYRGNHRRLDTSAGGPFADHLDGDGNIGRDGTELWIAYLATDGDDGTGGGFANLRFFRKPANPGKPEHAEAVLHLPLTNVLDGNTHLLVAHVAFAAGPDTVTLFVDPDLSVAPASGKTLDAETTADASFDTLEISGEYYVKPAPSATWDEIRIGATARDVGFAAAAERGLAETPKTPKAAKAPETGDAAALAARAKASARIEKLGVVAQVWPYPQQTIKGWGGHIVGNEYWDTDQPDVLEVDEAVEAYYEGLGLTYVRANVHWDASVENAPPSRGYVFLRDRLKAAQAHGVKHYILACWSGPRRFTTGDRLKGFADADGDGQYDAGEKLNLLRPEVEDDYIAWYVGIVQALANDGLGLPLNVSVQNEPDQLAAHENVLMSPGQWARLVVKMRSALDAAGLQGVGVVGPDTNLSNLMSLQWDVENDIARPQDHDEAFGRGFLGGFGFTRLAEDPALNKALAAYAWHTYSQFDLTEVPEGLVRFPKDVWMTENSDAGGDDDFTWAFFQFRHFLSDMVDVPSNYWTHWIRPAFTAKPTKWGMLYIDPETRGVTPSKKHAVFSRLWTTVRPGWTVHPVRSNDPDMRTHGAGQSGWVNVDLAAFVSADRGQTVVAAVNPLRRSRRITLTGLHADSAVVYCTDPSRSDARIAAEKVARGTLVVELPAFSVNLIHAVIE